MIRNMNQWTCVQVDILSGLSWQDFITLSSSSTSCDNTGYAAPCAVMLRGLKITNIALKTTFNAGCGALARSKYLTKINSSNLQLELIWLTKGIKGDRKITWIFKVFRGKIRGAKIFFQQKYFFHHLLPIRIILGY